jgi:small basic protein
MCSMVKPLAIAGALAFAFGGVASALLNLFDAGGAVAGIVFILVVAICGLFAGVVDDHLPPPRPRH